MRLLCPIKPEYLNHGHTCLLNQLFGENPNSLFYGPEGHTGLDIKTTGGVKYVRSGTWVWNGENWGADASWKRVEPTKQEDNGRIPLVACHDGEISTILYDNKQGMGWGVLNTAESEIENGKEVQYRTLYWHIETPWGSLASFDGFVKSIAELKKIFERRQVKAGAIIAISGNNGMSTGPHLHLALDRREKLNGVWGAWKRINPLPYLGVDGELVTYQNGSIFFYQGVSVSKTEYQKIIKHWPKVV